jgi:hypothetical protein
MDQQGGKQISKSGDREVGEHRKKVEPREKSAQKSKDKMETLARNLSGAITPNKKKASKREQDLPKRSWSMRKKGLLKFFGEGPHVPAPTTEGTPIEAATKRRDKRPSGNTNSKKRKPVELDVSAQRKKTRSDNKEFKKHDVNIERMEKTPLKTKGKRDDSDKKEKKRRIWRKANHPKREERRQHL